MPDRFNLITVLGPTASGKTAFAAQLAFHLKGEVISADSRQVYRRMNLGTGKDYDDYWVSGIQVPCHLVDIVEPGYHYSVFEFQRDFFRVFREIRSRNRFPVLCGGSGMYIDAATRGYRMTEVPRNEELRVLLESKSLIELGDILSSLKVPHNTTDLDTTGRAIRAIEIARYHRDNPLDEPGLPNINPLFIGIRYERAEERLRITERLMKRLDAGMVEEVEQLLASGLPAESIAYYGLEYRYITRYLQGQLDYATMVSLLNTAIHQFAKRQRSWFRNMERKGTRIHWFDGHMSDALKIKAVLTLLGR